jgi:hypothetical protein
MASGYRLEDFTLEKTYKTLIKDTGTEEFVKVNLGDSTAWMKNGAVEVIESAKDGTRWITDNAREVGSSAAKTLDWAVLTPAKAISSGIELADSAIIDIVDYLSPTSASLNSFKKMGEDMDNLIKENLFLQFFGITYTDVLCSAFCMVVSLLSCKQRSQLYRSVIELQRGAIALDAIADAVDSAVTQFNVGVAGLESVLEAAQGVASGNLTDTYETQSTGQSAARGIAGIQASIENIAAIADTISIALEVINAGRILEPIVQYSNIWNLARNILFEMQAMAMNWAEEVLMKIIQPIEDLIAKIQPTNCLGNMGGVIFNKILGTITGYKNWLVTQIGSLFTEFYSFSKMLKTFNRKSKSTLEIAMFTEALKTLAHRFGDLAIVCGVEPCYEDDDSSNNYDSAKAGRPIESPIGESSIITFSDIPLKPENNIEEIAESMKDMLPVPVQDIYVTNDTITTIYDAIADAPKKLLDMAKEINLGNNYEIAISQETSSVKIVHTTKRYCGE